MLLLRIALELLQDVLLLELERLPSLTFSLQFVTRNHQKASTSR
jgi:hypothetical protein